MIEVDLPDGSIAEFPDGTPPEVMKRALQKRFGGDDPYYRTISEGWSSALKAAFKSLPDLPL